MIYVLYGQPGSGKTVLSRSLAEHFGTPFIINEHSQCCWQVERALRLLDERHSLDILGGVEKQTIKNARDVIRRARDEFRGVFTNRNPGREEVYDRKGREENIRNANVAATFANKALDGRPPPLITSLVNPYEHLRNELKENNKDQVVEVLLKSNRELRKKYHVEDFEVGDPDYIMDTDVGDVWSQLKDLLKI